MKTLIEQYAEVPAHLRGVQREALVLEMTEAIARAMRYGQVSKAELARRLGKSQAYVTRLLDGRVTLTLAGLADVFTVCGRSICAALLPIRVGDTSIPADGYERACLDAAETE